MTEEELQYLEDHPIDLVGDLSGTISDQASAAAESSANASSTLSGGKRRKRKSRRQHNKRKAKTLMSEHKKLVGSSKPLNYKNYGEGRQRGGWGETGGLVCYTDPITYETNCEWEGGKRR
jgi:hypothetical protein